MSSEGYTEYLDNLQTRAGLKEPRKPETKEEATGKPWTLALFDFMVNNV